MAKKTGRAVVDSLLRQIDEAYDVRSWHGTNLRGSLRGLTPTAAAWRPGRGRHNAWELAVHCAYWKYAVRRRLTGGDRGSFAIEGSNWFERPAGPATAASWRADLALLASEHRQLRAVVARLRDADLARRAGKGTVAFLLRGVAAHDLYHAGQIQLLKRLR
jgi:uncharacterized damage-inducible protein DinB